MAYVLTHPTPAPERTTMSNNTLKSRAAFLEGQLAELHDKLAVFSTYGEDVYEDGTVLAFERDFGTKQRLIGYDSHGKARYEAMITKSYHYCAIRMRNLWWLTGKTSEPKTWDALIEFITDDGRLAGNPVWRVTEYEQVEAE